MARVRSSRPTRNQAIEAIGRGGFAVWRERTDYGRRALAETGMYRLKQHTSGRLGARRHDAQDAELILRCNILNKLAEQARLLGPADRFIPDEIAGPAGRGAAWPKPDLRNNPLAG